jgi:hypothetical protein
MADQVHTGGCLCGGVRYQVVGRLQLVVDCHCSQCRRTHGHVAAYTAAAKSALDLVEDAGLHWYASSPGVRRGFCATCGASVFWERVDGPDISIAAGTLDAPTGLATIGHIYVGDAGDYYVIADNLPRFAGSDQGALDSNVTEADQSCRFC